MTKDLVIKEIEHAIIDYCEIMNYSFSYENYLYEVYNYDKVLQFILSLTEGKNNLFLESALIFIGAKTQSDGITLRKVSMDEEIQEHLRQYNLELDLVENILYLSLTGPIPDEISLIKSQALLHISSQIFHVLLLRPIFWEKLYAEDWIREN